MPTHHLLILAIIVVFVIAFIITMIILNASAKSMIDANTKLVENHNLLLELNKEQVREIEVQMKELDQQNRKLEQQNRKLEQQKDELEQQKGELEQQKGELEEQKGMIEILQKQQEELAEHLSHDTTDDITMMKQQAQEQQEYLENTADMTDEQLMSWVDWQMDKTKLFSDSKLTLKTMANALGLTQKRLGGLFKNHPKYSTLSEYINEKRFVYACQLLRDEPNWTIEAVGTKAGYGGRRTFQTEVKRRLGLTPSQYRHSLRLGVAPKRK